jgi:hypothetical protein
MFFNAIIIFNILVLINARFLRVEEDMKMSEKLHDQLYNGLPGRRLGSIDELELDVWRNNYTNGKFIIPVTLLEDDFEEGTNQLSTTLADDIFDTLVEMADKLDNIIEFVRYDGVEPKPANYIRIGNFGGGCWSYVGRIPGQFQPQPLNIGSSCLFVDIIEHEMMHALGFFHEQARPDRDDHVIIHWDNIDVSKYVNFEKALEINSRGSPYDYESIMHYTSTAFALDPQFPTISMKDPKPGVTLGSALTMTNHDMDQLRMLYRCEDTIRTTADNCIDTCPCRLNEGNCTSSTQCEGILSCIDNICVDGNATAAPTTSPTTGTPTSSPVTASPTLSPTPQVTIPVPPTSPPVTSPPTVRTTSAPTINGNNFDTGSVIYVTVGFVGSIFVIILISNVI